MSLNGTEERRPVRVALDVMGGDYAPVETVKGAMQALRSANAELLLVGDPAAVQAELAKYDTSGMRVTVVPSEGRIGDDEHPVQAMRQKPHASVVVATQLVKQGKADVMVSIGSTGASMASAVLSLGLMEGLERPCLGGPFLGLAPNTVLVDIGSNLDCRPGLLLSFAVLGAAFAHTYMGIENPRIGLLSVGEEAAKGNRQVQESYQLFQESHLNFVGNVEGMDFFTNKADVIICDGFVGNILLKFTEGMGGALGKFVRDQLSGKVDAAVVDGLGRRPLGNDQQAAHGRRRSAVRRECARNPGPRLLPGQRRGGRHPHRRPVCQRRAARHHAPGTGDHKRHRVLRTHRSRAGSR